MTKIAIVNQRYGAEVNGGSEQHAKMLAERLAALPGYSVEVLTTCALNHITWENHYPEGVSDDGGIKIRRFLVDEKRDIKKFDEYSDEIFGCERTPQAAASISREDGLAWIKMQGPYCPELIEYIKENHTQYDVFIFVTYLYYTTVRGIVEVKNKAILVPTAHNEPPIYLGIYKDVFQCPGGIAYNSFEEREFLLEMFDINHISSDIFGVGVDVPENISPMHFREKYRLSNYILYAGRIEESKNCTILFDFFNRYKERNPSDLKLVLMGREVCKVPEHPDIISLGFVSEEDKMDGMAGARLFVLPSSLESLSIVVLESMAVGVPVLVNGECDVLVGHCRRSNAGLYYNGFFEFEGCINYLLAPEHSGIYESMRINAREYVKANYDWKKIISKYKTMITNITNKD